MFIFYFELGGGVNSNAFMTGKLDFAYGVLNINVDDYFNILFTIESCASFSSLSSRGLSSSKSLYFCLKASVIK